MDNPFGNARKALDDARNRLASQFEPIRQQAQSRWEDVCGFVSAQQRKIGHGSASRVAFASMSQSRGFQPLFDLAMGRDALKARLSSVPVYTVTNKKNEFVLLSSEMTRQASGGKGRVGLVFMSEKAAVELIDKLRKDNPKLGKNTKVLSIGLDSLYDLMTIPASAYGMDGVTFRLVPDAEEVANALEVYRSAGVPARSITGVPVFQAEGLSVSAPDNKRATPLFLSKSDLDIALKTAGRNKNERDEVDLREKTEGFKQKANDARKKMESCEDAKEVRKWKQVAEKAESRAADTQKQLEKVIESCPKTRVEVGSLEDVIGRMGDDKKGTWSNVLFVRQGVITDLREEQLAADKKQ
ncbi:hypothetical protein BSKO_11274 [Bryopsis sp. KO-2023]|nr:hypothetical protein BSKO_11274 [Bryopsis sp. KO-2023]